MKKDAKQAVNQGSYYLSSGLASGAQALKDNLGGGNKIGRSYMA